MGVFFFYNNRKPRKFDHKPILYDPDKERREANMQSKIIKAKQEMGILSEKDSEEKNKPTLKEEFYAQAKHLSKRKEREQEDDKPFFSNNKKLTLVLIIIVVIAYFVYFR